MLSHTAFDGTTDDYVYIVHVYIYIYVRLSRAHGSKLDNQLSEPTEFATSVSPTMIVRGWQA